MPRKQYRLEDAADELKVPPTTIVTWLGELGQSMRWIQGRYYLTSETLERLRSHQSGAQPASAPQGAR